MKISLNIGIDLGRTLVTREPGFPAFPQAIEVIKRLKEKHNLFIVSRVNSEQKERAEQWLKNNEIYNIIPSENVYFCFERRDKAFFAAGLNCDIFIDDRPECLAFMNKKIHKILFNPDTHDFEKWLSKLTNYSSTNTWVGVEYSISNQENLQCTTYDAGI